MVAQPYLTLSMVSAWALLLAIWKLDQKWVWSPVPIWRSYQDQLMTMMRWLMLYLVLPALVDDLFHSTVCAPSTVALFAAIQEIWTALVWISLFFGFEVLHFLLFPELFLFLLLRGC